MISKLCDTEKNKSKSVTIYCKPEYRLKWRAYAIKYKVSLRDYMCLTAELLAAKLDETHDIDKIAESVNYDSKDTFIKGY